MSPLDKPSLHWDDVYVRSAGSVRLKLSTPAFQSFFITSTFKFRECILGHGLPTNTMTTNTRHPNPIYHSKTFHSISVWSVISSGLIAAVLVTGALYLVGGDLLDRQVSRRVSKEQQYYHGGHYTHGAHGQDRWGRRQDTVLHRVEKILSFLSVDSLQVCSLQSHNNTWTRVIGNHACRRKVQELMHTSSQLDNGPFNYAADMLCSRMWSPAWNMTFLAVSPTWRMIASREWMMPPTPSQTALMLLEGRVN